MVHRAFVDESAINQGPASIVIKAGWQIDKLRSLEETNTSIVDEPIRVDDSPRIGHPAAKRKRKGATIVELAGVLK